MGCKEAKGDLLEAKGISENGPTHQRKKSPIVAVGNKKRSVHSSDKSLRT
jgi:hypothetical protein